MCHKNCQDVADSDVADSAEINKVSHELADCAEVNEVSHETSVPDCDWRITASSGTSPVCAESFSGSVLCRRM